MAAKETIEMGDEYIDSIWRLLDGAARRMKNRSRDRTRCYDCDVTLDPVFDKDVADLAYVRYRVFLCKECFNRRRTV